MVERYVVAIDQGTTSTRCIVFDQRGRLVAVSQREHHQHYPKPGWVEHDAMEIWHNLEHIAPRRARPGGVDDRPGRGCRHHQPARDDRGLGPAHRQARRARRSSGRTPAPTGSLDLAGARRRWRRRSAASGLPLATYFSAPQAALAAGPLAGAAGARPSAATRCSARWRVADWNLTGGPDGGVHVTDVTNASRTMLMNLETLEWDDRAAGLLRRSPAAMLPEIRSSAEVYGAATRSCRACGSRPRWATSRPRCSVRPASRRRGQVHLRHRQLPAAQHR